MRWRFRLELAIRTLLMSGIFLLRKGRNGDSLLFMELQRWGIEKRFWTPFSNFTRMAKKHGAISKILMQWPRRTRNIGRLIQIVLL